MSKVILMVGLSATNYTPTPNPSQPGFAQAPFAGWTWNPEGSAYAGLAGQGTSDLLRKDMSRVIVDSIPARFKLMQFFYKMPIEYVNDKETWWKEEQWNRVPIIPTGNVGGGATQIIPCTGISAAGTIGLQAQVSYPDGTKGIVIAIASDTFTVQAQTGQTLPAVTAATDYLVIDNYPKADGMNYFVGYSRLNLLTYYNYIAMFERTKRWARQEQVIHQNNGVTDYMEKDKSMLLTEIYQDAFITFINGKKGEFTFTAPGGTNSYRAMTCNGIYPQMVEAGSQNSPATPDTIQSVFELLAFNTNYKGVDEPRLVLCTDKMWYHLSKIMKDPIRYAPSDKTMDLNLEMWRLGNMKFIPMKIEQFSESAYMFPSFENKIIVIDQSKIKPLCMKGYEPFETRQTALSLKNGGREDYDEWYAHAMISSKLETPDGHFWIDGVDF